MQPVRTIDYHTAGEPFRIVLDGVPEIAGATVLERRATAQASPSIDAVRQLLVQEPRGHADMYGCFLVPPNDDDAAFGVLFWHKDGYSTACGHGTIALGAWAVATGRAPAGTTEVPIDVPSGRVIARVQDDGGVSFRNVPSYVLARDVEVVTRRGPIRVEVSYGGAIYASVAASSLGLAVTPEHHNELIALGREIKWALNATEWARQRGDSRLNGIYATILYDDLGETDSGPHQRNVAIFADGQLDRSPCGSGTSARMALLAEDGRLAEGQVLVHDSIIGTRFTGRLVGSEPGGVLTEITGTAFATGESVFRLDPADSLGTGFLLR